MDTFDAGPESPAVWHHGLMAEFWARCKREAPELPGLLAYIERFGQPVLDLGCGAGRILDGLLAAGVDADGADGSVDMIAHARAAAGAAGHAPALFVQPMHRLDPPRQYRTIVIVDSFGLGTDHDHDLEALRRCHAALEPGGALVFNVQVEYILADVWKLWTRQGRANLPEPWPARAIERTAPNGDVYRLRIRTLHASPLRQSFTREMRIEKWIAGSLAREESATLVGSMYLPTEIRTMARAAGFAAVDAFDGFSDRSATDDSENVVFVAQRV